MKTTIRILVFIFLSSFIANTNLFAGGSLIRGGAENDTLIVTFDCDVYDFANPFLLRANSDDYVIFKAINGEFSILIRNADEFFQDVGQIIKIHLNNGEESNLYKVKSVLPIDSEIKYEVYCIDQNKWADVPPRIIIIPRDEQ